MRRSYQPARKQQSPPPQVVSESTLLLKLNRAPESVQILRELNDNLDFINQFTKVRIHALSTEDLQSPKVLDNLKSRGVMGLPALIKGNNGEVIMGDVNILDTFRNIDIAFTGRRVKPTKKNDFEVDHLDHLKESLISSRDQEDVDGMDLTKKLTKTNVEDLRDRRLSSRITSARHRIEQRTGRPTVASRIKQAKTINPAHRELRDTSRSKHTRGGPISYDNNSSDDERTMPSARSRSSSDESASSESEESESEPEYQPPSNPMTSEKKKELREYLEDDEIHSSTRLGKVSASNIRNKAMQGMSGTRQNRGDNLSALTDDSEDSVDKLLKSICKNKE